MNKRGLSGIVVAILLILLAIVAIGIIFGLINIFIKKSSENVSVTPFTNLINIKDAKIGLLAAKIAVEKKPGTANLSSLKFFFNDGVNFYTYEQKDNLPKDFETKIYTINLENGVKPTATLTVIPFYNGKAGLENKETLVIDYTSATNNGLVGYWKFDGDAKDSSGNGNDGSINGTLQFTNGKVSQAALFNGINTTIQDSKIPSAMFGGNYSIVGWFQLNSLPSIGTNQVIAQKRSIGSLPLGSRGQLIIGITNSDDFSTAYPLSCGPAYIGMQNNLSFMFGALTNSTVTSTCGRWIFSGEKIEAGTKWYHFVGTFNTDINESRIYLNSILNSLTTLNVDKNGFNTNLAIGGRPDGYGGGWAYFNGTIDEMIIFNKVLTDAEIRQIYDSQK